MLITSCVAYLIYWDDEFVHVIFPFKWDMYIFLVTFPDANIEFNLKNLEIVAKFCFQCQMNLSELTSVTENHKFSDDFKGIGN